MKNDIEVRNKQFKEIEKIISNSENVLIKNAISNMTKLSKEGNNDLIWNHMGKIYVLLNHTPPWCGLTPAKFNLAKELIYSYVMSHIYLNWITPQMKLQDQIFYDKITTLTTLITPEYLDINLSIMKTELIDETVKELVQLDLLHIDAPIQLLYHIYTCYNNLLVAIQKTITSDSLVSLLMLVIVRAHPHHLISMCQWIEQWSDPNTKQDSELFCVFTNLMVAITYLQTLKPENSLIRVDLSGHPLPEMILNRISQEEYLSIIDPIRQLLNSFTQSYSREIGERVKGAGIGGTIGAIVAAPIALLFSFLTTGFGIPFSLGIISTGMALGTSLGAVIPLNIQKMIVDTVKYIDYVNQNQLKKYGIVLLNPFITNRLYLASRSFHNITTLEFMVSWIKP